LKNAVATAPSDSNATLAQLKAQNLLATSGNSVASAQ